MKKYKIQIGWSMLVSNKKDSTPYLIRWGTDMDEPEQELRYDMIKETLELFPDLQRDNLMVTVQPKYLES